MKTTVNQHLIAKRLGLSQSTVAGALSNSPRFAKETRDRVWAEANRLGYRPHRFARIMRKGKSGFIGMVQCAGYVPFAWQRAQHVARAVHSHGYQLFPTDAFWFTDEDRTACDIMRDANVEGVILLSPCYPFEALKKAGIPMVGVSGARLVKVPQVRADVRQGMKDLARYLVGLGYRRLVLLVRWPLGARDEFKCWFVNERVEGFRSAVNEAGLSESEAEVYFEEYHGSTGDPYEVGKVAMRKVLQRSNRPEAVLCSNDDWALGALAACAEAKVRVPDDIAVTGFDNILVGDYGAVPLTTVAQPIEQMAIKAVGIVVKMIRGEKLIAAEQLVRMPCEVVVRQSCGAVLRRE